MNLFFKAALPFLSCIASMALPHNKVVNKIAVVLQNPTQDSTNDTLTVIRLGELMQKGNSKEQEEYKKQFFESVAHFSDPRGLGHYFKRNAEDYNLRGKYYDAVSSAKMALLVFKTYGLTEDYMYAVNLLSLSLLQVKRVDEALALCNTALSEYKNYPEGKVKSGILSKRGTAYFEKRDYRRALADYRFALRGYRMDGFTNGEFYTYNQISMCYQEMSQLHEAEEYVMKSVKKPEFKKLPYTNKALLYDRLAFIYFKMRRYGKSLAYSDTARANCPSDNLSLMKQIKTNKAMTLFFLEDTQGALQLAQEVIGDDVNMNTYRRRDAYYVVGLCQFKSANFVKARRGFEIAIKSAQTIDSAGYGNSHNFDVLSDSKKKLSLIALGNNNPEKSYALLEESYKAEQERLKAFKDVQLHKEVNTFELGEKRREVKQLTREQLRNRLEIREQQNKMILLISCLIVAVVVVGFTYRGYCIKKRNASEQEQKRKIIEKQKERLESAFKERGVLLKEIHHRVKNNFQMIISLLQIQADEGGYSNVDAFLEEAVSRILSMSLIHQNLYQSDNLSEVDFHDYIQQLISHTEHALAEEGKVLFVADIPRVMIDLQLAVPLGLILNEMILNSIKHVKTATGTVVIKIRLEAVDSAQWLLCYDDNGKKPEDGNRRSFGSELIQLLVMQIAGKLELGEAENVSYRIHFKTA